MKISELPNGLRELALKRQRECRSNEFDPTTDELFEAFLWDGTIEGFCHWDRFCEGDFSGYWNCKIINLKPKRT